MDRTGYVSADHEFNPRIPRQACLRSRSLSSRKMKSRTPPLLKWLLICAVGAVVGWVVWLPLEDFSRIDLPVQASRAVAIGYGTLQTVNGSSRIVIDEVWKQPASGSSLSVGTVVQTLSSDRGSRRPDGFIVFFERAGWFRSVRLQSNAVIAVYKGRVATDGMPVAEAKALCSAPES